MNIDKLSAQLPPNAIETEMCLLCSMILAGNDPAALLEIRAAITSEMFFQADHRIIFDAICRIIDRTGAIDAMLLREEMIKTGTLDDVGGLDYLSQILMSAPSYTNGVHYAEIVSEKHRLRELLSLSLEMHRSIHSPTNLMEPASEIAQRAANRIARLVQGGKSNQFSSVSEIVTEVYENLLSGERPAVTTGYPMLDDLTGGIQRGEMCIVAARPSMGKSTLAKQMALRVARSGISVGYLSLEEGRFKIGRNLLASEAKIDNHKLRKPKSLTEIEWTELASGVSRLSEIPIYVNDRVRRLSDVCAAAAMMVTRFEVKMLVLDYLQRVSAPGHDKYAQISNASLGVSDLIKELDVAGVVLAQLSRETARREDKRPMLTDLRDTGKIEEDADGVIFLHREDYYHLDDQNYQPTNEAELIIAKWRDGLRNKIVKLRSNLRFQSFEDLYEEAFT